MPSSLDKKIKELEAEVSKSFDEHQAEVKKLKNETLKERLKKFEKENAALKRYSFKNIYNSIKNIFLFI